MKSQESDMSQEQTAPQQGESHGQMSHDDSPAVPDRTGPTPGDTVTPGRSPQEIRPGPDENVQPGEIPSEIEPVPDDQAEPGLGPDELPGQAQ